MTLNVQLPLRTQRLLLRLPRPTDCRALSRAGNYRQVARGTYVPYPFPPSAARRYIAARRSGYRSGRALSLVIEDRSVGTVLGMVGLGSINLSDRTADLYYWLSPEQWGKGFAREALDAMLSLAFIRLSIHRVTAYVHTFNERSLRLLRRFGFRVEGRLREARPEGRRWYAVLVLGLLDREFRRRPVTGRSRARAVEGLRKTL